VISVRVPATSANLGPGYDAVGLALSLSTRIALDRASHPSVEVSGTGAGLIPRGPEHPAYRAARFVAELVGESDAQFRLVQENPSPRPGAWAGAPRPWSGGPSPPTTSSAARSPPPTSSISSASWTATPTTRPRPSSAASLSAP